MAVKGRGSNTSGGPARSLPILAFAGYDSADQIDGILTQLENGYFSQAAILSDAMRRDDRIESVRETRVGALKACPLKIEPADDKRASMKWAKFWGMGSENAAGEWDRAFSAGSLADISDWGNVTGIGVAQILWDTSRTPQMPRLVPWHSQFVRWDRTTQVYKLRTVDGEIDLPKVDENPNSDGEWLVWCPRGYHYAWLKGLVRSLAFRYIMRAWNYTSWARFNEVHGMPIRKAIVPAAKAESALADAYVETIANMNGETTVKVPQGEDGNKYDIAYAEPVSKSMDTFENFKKQLDTDIAVLVLGQNLTTDAQGGSLALGKVQDLVRRDKLKEDADLARCIRDQVLWHWARRNFGDPTLAPRPVYVVDPPADRKTRAEQLGAVGTALSQLKLAGAPVDVRAVCEEEGVPTLTEEEVEAQEATNAEENEPDPEAATSPNAEPTEPEAAPAKLSGKNTGMGVVKRYEFQGLPIAVENPAGTVRMWTDHDGKTGSTRMSHDYGYIEGHAGADGEDLDCYVGGDENARSVYVVHQAKAPDFKAYDEDKLMLGFGSDAAARGAYAAHRNDGERAIMGMSSIPVDRFKAKLKRRTGSGRIRASRDVVTAILALSRRAGAKTAQLRKKPNDYPDRLAGKAMDLAAKALGKHLRALKADVIAGASDFADLEKRLVAYYRDKMKPDELAEVVRRCRLMAHVAGQLSAIKDAA